MGKLSDLPNIGKVNEEKLLEIGVDTPEKLMNLGSREAFRRIRFNDNTACINMLCGLEGAIQGVRWHGLPEEVKKDLKSFYHSL